MMYSRSSIGPKKLGDDSSKVELTLPCPECGSDMNITWFYYNNARWADHAECDCGLTIGSEAIEMLLGAFQSGTMYHKDAKKEWKEKLDLQQELDED